MNSFYGGPAGQSFTIKKIFTSKNGQTDSLASDLALGWSSLILVGDFVVVSYGLPSEPNYDIFKQLDLDIDHVSYNSTLWRKEYNEQDGEPNGLYYKLIASLTGNTPKISVNLPTTVLKANENPSVTMDSTDVDNPKLTFSLPRSQILGMKDLIVLDADQKPKVEYDDTEDIDHPTITFSLPQAQNLKSAEIEEVLLVGETPEVRLDKSGENGVNEPVIKFKLPASQEILPSNVKYEALNANEKPKVVFDLGSNPNHPTLTFYLPQSQVMGTPQTLVIGPDGRPSVSIDSSSINAPFLNFQLPRAVHFYYGDLLGDPNKREEPFQDTNDLYSGYGVGDYYINVPSGYIYVVTGVDGTTVTFDYLACLLAPKPQIGETVALDPYTGESPTEPKVDMSVDEAEHTWELTFSLPKMPVFDIDQDFIAAPADSGSVSTSIVDNTKVLFSFKIPRGSRLFNGNGEPQEVEGAKDGDYYLNTATGKIYQFASSEWQEQEGSLQGPVGNALNIVADYRIEEREGYLDTLANSTQYITDNYHEPISNEDIFAITWVSLDKSSEISYWQYQLPDGTWARAQLTGGIASILVKEYSEDANKAYNTGYINSLINGDETKKDKTAYSKEQVEKLLSWGTFEELKEV